MNITNKVSADQLLLNFKRVRKWCFHLQIELSSLQGFLLSWYLPREIFKTSPV